MIVKIGDNLHDFNGCERWKNGERFETVKSSSNQANNGG